MGKSSRAKSNRVPAPVPRLSMKSFSLDRSTWMFLIGIFVLSYGTAALQYSRWNHVENASVRPVFHPWAIVGGIAIIVLSLTRRRVL
jgi:hypothetical protein